MLHLWQLRRATSLRRHAQRQLRAERQVHGAAWTWEKLRRWTNRAEPSVIVPLAMALHAPMALYLGREPAGWLDGAWQVSGVMVGLVVTLIIFLLQSAGDQSLRSEQTFRAVLRRTGVLWPIAWAITFIGSVAIVERFAGASGPAGDFVESYTLCLFVVQVALFGAALFRAIRIVSPQGVARELAKQFRDGVVVAVEADFAQRLATARMLERCQEEEVSFGSFLARGWPVTPESPGWVVDMDARLPRKLSALGLGAGTTITAQPGEQVGPKSPLAVSDTPLGRSPHVLVQSAVRVRRWGGPPQAPIAVFHDAVDLAHRALIDGSNVSQDLAVDLIADCFLAFHDAHALYGVDY